MCSNLPGAGVVPLSPDAAMACICADLADGGRDRTSQACRLQMAHPAKPHGVTLRVNVCLLLQESPCVLGAVT